MNPTFQVVVEQLLSKWRAQAISHNLGATEEELRLLEQATAFQFDASFLTYLRQANGMVDFAWDEDLFSFWSTTRIVEEIGHHPAELVCFADWSINAGSFGFHRIQPDPRIFLHYQTGDMTLWVVTETFTEFLSIYLLDAESLLR